MLCASIHCEYQGGIVRVRARVRVRVRVIDKVRVRIRVRIRVRVSVKRWGEGRRPVKEALCTAEASPDMAASG